MVLHTRFHGHVLFASDAEVALYGAPAHGTTLQLVEAARTYAGMPGNIKKIKKML